MPSNVERWLPVVGWEGLYEVSDQGRVKSLDRVVMQANGKTRSLRGKVLKAGVNSEGYLVVRPSRAPRVKTLKVAAIVAAAFIGPRPAGLVILHGEGGKLDNSLSNLSYGTCKENEADKLRDGTHNRGERHACAKLTREQVLFARKEAASKPSEVIARLAKQWGVHQGTLRQAVRGENWGWLS
jgi:hypothetical protein